MSTSEKYTYETYYRGNLVNVYPAIEYKHKWCHSLENAFCIACPFARRNNGLDKPCRCLDLIDIYSIYEKSKEDKKMTNKEEIQQEIEKTQKQLAALQEKLKEAEDEVPDTLDFSDHSGWYIGPVGEVIKDTFNPNISDTDRLMIKNHLAFKSEECARMFSEKTRLIADLLHFKYLYDKGYEPDWNNNRVTKWTVWIPYNDYTNPKRRFKPVSTYEMYDPEKVYFSTEEIAQKCADWLNKIYGKE